MSKFKRGDKVEASESYKQHIREDGPTGAGWSAHSFVVSKVVSGPYYHPNKNGYREGGWVNDDAVYDDRGVVFPASELAHSSDNCEPEQPKKKGWFW